METTTKRIGDTSASAATAELQEGQVHSIVCTDVLCISTCSIPCTHTCNGPGLTATRPIVEIHLSITATVDPKRPEVLMFQRWRISRFPPNCDAQRHRNPIADYLCRPYDQDARYNEEHTANSQSFSAAVCRWERPLSNKVLACHSTTHPLNFCCIAFQHPSFHMHAICLSTSDARYGSTTYTFHHLRQHT